MGVRFFSQMENELKNYDEKSSEYNRLLILKEDIINSWKNRKKKRHKYIKQEIVNITHITCNTCSELKPKDEFYYYSRRIFYKCKSCYKCKLILRDRIKSLISGIQTGKKNKDRDIINIHYFLKLLWSQKGLCKISNNILTINGDMMISPERIDEKLGYINKK